MSKCTSRTGRHLPGSWTEQECPEHGLLAARKATAAAPTASMSAPQPAPGRDQPPAYEGTLGSLPEEIVEDLISRRSRQGASREESAALLGEFVRSHSGANLASALVYNNFARTPNVDRIVRDIDATRPPTRRPSPKPQSARIETLRGGDTFEDGEFRTREEVLEVTDQGDNIYVTTDASQDAGAGAYRFRKGETVWATTA